MDDGEDDELRLVRASASLLADLEASIPKLLWKLSRSSTGHLQVHRYVKEKELAYVKTLVYLAQHVYRPACLTARRLSPFKESRSY